MDKDLEEHLALMQFAEQRYAAGEDEAARAAAL